MSARSGAANLGARGALLRDADEIFNVFRPFGFEGFGRNTGTSHGVQRLVDGIEEKAHIADERGDLLLVPLGGGGKQALNISLGLSHVQAALYDDIQRFFALHFVFQPKKGARVAFGKVVLQDLHALLARELQKPELVREGRLRFAEAAGGLLLCDSPFVDKPRNALGLFKKGKVAALEIFQQGEHGGALFVRMHLDAGDFGEAGHAGGAVAALSGDDFKAPVFPAAYGDGLQNAVFEDAFRKPQQLVLIEPGAGLAGVRNDTVGGNQQDMPALPHGFIGKKHDILSFWECAGTGGGLVPIPPGIRQLFASFAFWHKPVRCSVCTL